MSNLLVFDIKDIYPSLPKYDVLSEIKNRINDNKFVTSLDKCALIELIILSLEFMSFTIDQKYYNRNQGLFIVAPTSSYFAEIYIQRVEENHVYTMLNAISHTHSSSNQPLHVKLTTVKTLVRKAKFIFSDQTSLKEELSYIRKTIQLNGYPLNVINKTIKDTLQSHNSEHKRKELEPLKMFIPYEKDVAKN